MQKSEILELPRNVRKFNLVVRCALLFCTLALALSTIEGCKPSSPSGVQENDSKSGADNTLIEGRNDTIGETGLFGAVAWNGHETSVVSIFNNSSITIPVSWTTKKESRQGQELWILQSSSADELAPSIKIMKSKSKGKLDDFAKDSIRKLSLVVPKFREISRSLFETLNGYKGIRIETESRQSVNDLRQLFYFFEWNESEMLIITATDIVRADREKFLKSFDTIVGTLNIEENSHGITRQH